MKKTGQYIFPILTLFSLAATVFLTMAWISPPAPLPTDSPATDFSARRAMQDLEIIAQEPHPMGISQAHADVRDYLLSAIRTLGLEPQVQNTFGERIVHPGFVCGGMVENILIRLPGTDPEGAILLSSHYDSTPGSPGGVDSGSGVVTILEILRTLQAGPPLRQDVIFFFTDGEEPCIIGSYAFVAQHPWFKDVRLVINMDQFAEGPPMIVRTNGGNGTFIQALAHSASSTRPAYISFPFDLFPGGDSDLVPFALAGVPGAEIARSVPIRKTTLGWIAQRLPIRPVCSRLVIRCWHWCVIWATSQRWIRALPMRHFSQCWVGWCIIQPA
jgi:hypothetical protein